MNRKIIIPLIVLALVSMACSFTVNVPTIKTGETQTTTLQEAIPTGGTDPMRLEIEMGAGELDIRAGAQAFLEGTIECNVDAWQPEIRRGSYSVEVSQQSTGNVSVPEDKLVNEWDLRLGNYPTDLSIKAGAYQGDIDLTGLPIVDLEITDGASQVNVTFDSLNPVAMDRFRYETGASQVNLTGLSNANFEEMIFKGGTGSYTLDFAGALQRDAHLSLTTGMSNVRLVFPEDLPVRVNITGGLNNVSPSGTWSITDGAYERPGNGGPMLTVDVEMGLGNLDLVVP
ncbi:MAG TPA: toast rack family protein [Anaerolineaceae bacterium]|nr:toast rack family protein [Anaerolineaceae bacterium]